VGISDFIDKAKDMMSGNKDKVKDGVEKAADMVDEKTGGKFSDQVDKGEETAKDFVEGLDE
jgi:TRAP-type mannitol/chloroaromatic compound transport system substrate-binding protein